MLPKCRILSKCFGFIALSLDSRTIDAIIWAVENEVSWTSFTFMISFLNRSADLELYFHLIVALLKYSIACALYTHASTPIIPIEHNVNVPQPSAGMCPNRDDTFNFSMQFKCLAYFRLKMISLLTGKILYVSGCVLNITVQRTCTHTPLALCIGSLMLKSYSKLFSGGLS